ncbi:MAG: methyltransferase domain-containing protein [Candidatus Micrarchaeota archaeon]
MKKAKEFFDKYAKEYEEQDRYQYLFYRWLVDNIIREVPDRKCRVADLGAGSGGLAIRLAERKPKAQVTCVDVSKGMMKVAMGKVRVAGIKNMKFKASPIEGFGGRADYVVSNLAFHHVKNKAAVISRIRKSLREGGRLVIGDWFKPSSEYKEKVWRLRKKNPKRAREFDRSWAQALKGMSKEYQEKHPKEYPICPLELKKIMDGFGFRKTRVLVPPLANFAIVVGEK